MCKSEQDAKESTPKHIDVEPFFKRRFSQSAAKLLEKLSLVNT
jgi:hypothetical protein